MTSTYSGSEVQKVLKDDHQGTNENYVSAKKKKCPQKKGKSVRKEKRKSESTPLPQFNDTIRTDIQAHKWALLIMRRKFLQMKSLVDPSQSTCFNVTRRWFASWYYSRWYRCVSSAKLEITQKANLQWSWKSTIALENDFGWKAVNKVFLASWKPSTVWVCQTWKVIRNCEE